MDFFASNLAMILLAVVGIGLVVVEMFLPGIGLPGISGLLMLLAFIWLVFRAYGAVWGIIACLGVIALVTAAIVVSLRSAKNGRLSRSALFLRQPAESAPEVAKEKESLVGREGVTQTPLRPSGIVLIGGERKSVVTEGEFLDAGKTVRVIHVNGSRIVVEPVSE